MKRIPAFPANPKARIQTVKDMIAAGDNPLRSELEHALITQLGFSHRRAKAFMSGGYRALAPEAAAAEELGDSMDALNALMRGACR